MRNLFPEYLSYPAPPGKSFLQGRGGVIETPLLKVSRSNSSTTLEDRELEGSSLSPGVRVSETGTAGAQRFPWNHPPWVPSSQRSHLGVTGAPPRGRGQAEPSLLRGQGQNGGRQVKVRRNPLWLRLQIFSEVLPLQQCPALGSAKFGDRRVGRKPVCVEVCPLSFLLPAPPTPLYGFCLLLCLLTISFPEPAIHLCLSSPGPNPTPTPTPLSLPCVSVRLLVSLLFVLGS